MYLSHYNLEIKPFQLTTDPRFLWLGEKYKEALATLKYGVVDQKGFLLVTGDVGTGKTTLINALLAWIGNDAIIANITNPILVELDFFNIVAHQFNINKFILTDEKYVDQFRMRPFNIRKKPYLLKKVLIQFVRFINYKDDLFLFCVTIV